MSDSFLNKEAKSTLISRNITVLGRRTSVRLEPEMWQALREIAKREQCRIHDLCSLISLRKNENTSLTAAIRVFMMLYYRAAATDIGHYKAGHGNFKNMLLRARIPGEIVDTYYKQFKSDGLPTGIPPNGYSPHATVYGRLQ